MQVSEAQHVAACEISAQVYRKLLKAADGKRILAEQHGININSAKDFIDDYRHLARGEEFQRAMSGAAMLHFMEQVAINEGPVGRLNAIKALRAHINYYEQGGRRTHMMRSVLAQFQATQTTDVIAEAGISAVSDALEPFRRKSMTQGTGLSASERRAVELAAMKAAEVELQRLGFTDIRDVAQTESFDFHAVLDGEPWVIEVNGTTNFGADQILLTANEVKLHQEFASRSCLIVVTQIRLDRALATAAGGVAVTFKPWGTKGWGLEPIAYRAVRLTL